MTGAEIVGTLLRASASLTAVVPAERIKLGQLPEGILLPALLVRVVSLIDRQPLKRTGWVRSIGRISVTVRAASYREHVEIIGLLRECCAGWTGNLAGAERISILTAGLGPDLLGPGNSFEQAQDFRVSFDAEI